MRTVAIIVALGYARNALCVPSRALAAPPAEFTPNPAPGGGGSRYRDSAHFRVYNTDDATADTALETLEAAYDCFVTGQGWRSPGLSINHLDHDAAGPWYKMNIYNVADLGPNVAANTPGDAPTGLSYMNVVAEWMTTPAVTVHEYGHALTYAEHTWIEQGRTGAWWEPVANFVADAFLTSAACADARAAHRQPEGATTVVNLPKVVGDAHQVLVDGTPGSGNYYDAWPFLAYLAANPDGYPGLGPAALPDLWRRYDPGSNETPLHVLARLVQQQQPAAGNLSAQDVVARYWARMAFVDIGHAQARARFEQTRGSLNYANLDSVGGGQYRVKAARRPQYLGANIVPLTAVAAAVEVRVQASAPFTATLAVRAPGGGHVRYVALADGVGSADLAAGEEAALVVVNTPDTLYLYDPFALSSEVTKGLDYQVQITGATV
ncbi:hypothetical protein F4780DRAFT_795493 [Xylariomycetidae sp. FL0641]|nr:hypothetical protein F4780DRAFT_795493 [Xylariomycetidae sp. FL0641]